MISGKPGEWYSDDCIGGYFDDNGHLVVCEEYGTDEDFDLYAIEVQNGDGYYDSAGMFVRFRDSD